MNPSINSFQGWFHHIFHQWTIRLLIILYGLTALPACSTRKEPAIDWDYLIKKYSARKEDSLFLASVMFLKENIENVTSQKLSFYNAKGDNVPVNFSDYENDTVLFDHIKKEKLTYRSKVIRDNELLTTEFVENNIQRAIATWHKYPWNRQVTQQQFLEMELPYKVLFEYPDDWRTYFVKGRYMDYFQGVLDSGYTDPNVVFYKGYIPAIEWLKYDIAGPKLNGIPSLSEIVCTKKTICFGSAQVAVYMLRSWGIPSTMDYVPYWGSKNGTHATEVFVGENGKIQTAVGRELKGAAKVYRFSFKRMDILADYAADTKKQIMQVLPFLSSDHVMDVTKEHTGTTEIVYPINNAASASYQVAYILIYNYGRWVPVFYGNIDDRQNARFKEMGVNMMYRIGVPVGNQVNILPGFIRIDGEGNQIPYALDDATKITMQVRKYSGGEQAFIKKGEKYNLQILTPGGDWEELTSQAATRDSIIIFDHVAANGIYRVVNPNGKIPYERPFTYKEGVQQWW